MPTYEYKCDSCHCRFERKQGFDEEPISICPECQGKTRRVLHSIPIIFKGSGFYVTDSRGVDTATVGAQAAKETGSAVKDNKAEAAKETGSAAKDSKAEVSQKPGSAVKDSTPELKK